MKHLLRAFFLLSLLAVVSPALAHGLKQPAPESAVKFTENKKQWDRDILFRAQLDGGALFLQKNAFTYHFYDKETLRKNHVNRKGSQGAIRTHAFKVNFLNSLSSVKV